MARNGSLPIIKKPFPQQHVVVGQLGLKLHETHIYTRQPATPTPGSVSINTVQMTLQSFLARPFLSVQRS